MQTDGNFAQDKIVPSILIVEDALPDKILVQKSLNRLGRNYRMVHAYSVEEAYYNFKKHEFDLILLDLNLPDGYGPSTVQEIRKMQKSLPLIAMTGALTDLVHAYALKMGANYVISKNEITEGGLNTIVQEYL